ADNLAWFTFTDNHSIVRGIALRPETLRQRLIDDDGARAAVILIRECAAPHNGNSEGLEVARRHHHPSRGNRPVGTSCDSKGLEEAVHEGHAAARCCGLYSRKRADAANALLKHLGHAGRRFELRTSQ